MKLRELGIKFIIITFAIMLALLFIEGALRLILGNRINRWINYQDPLYGWSHYANGKGIVRSADFVVHLNINSKGNWLFTI